MSVMPGPRVKSEEALNKQAKELVKKQAESSRLQREAMKVKQKELAALQQVCGDEREARRAPSDRACRFGAWWGRWLVVWRPGHRL